MLKALYDYGIRKQLALPAGYDGKRIKAYISLSDDLSYVGVHMGDERLIPCPDIGSLARGKDKSNVLVEKRSVVIPEEQTPKSRFFLDALRSASEYEPLLSACVKALENKEISEKIRAELDKARVKAADRVSFMINGISIPECENILPWWQEYRRELTGGEEKPSALCLITGQPTAPMTTTTPIQGLNVVGGHASGDALICFDKTAFCSYDLKKAANAPVSEEAFSVVKAALDELLRGAPVLAGMKFVHWFDREVKDEDDPFLTVDFGYEEDEDDKEDVPTVNEAEKRFEANELIKSVKSGETPPELRHTSYYILLLTGVSGRVMVRRFDRGNYAELRDNLRLWRSELALINPASTDLIKDRKLSARLIKLLKYQKGDSNPFKRLDKELSGVTPFVFNAIINGGALPDSVAARSLAYIRSELLSTDSEQSGRAMPLPDSVACQWLKVWLMRKNRKENREVPILEEYNMALENSAYHCGGLMAVYAAIQKIALKDVNAGVVERFYASAIQSPALVIGQLSKLCNHHLDKFESKGLAQYYRKKLTELACTLGTDIPVTLNLEQQSYFALGYYQMGAQLTKKKDKPEQVEEETEEE